MSYLSYVGKIVSNYWTNPSNPSNPTCLTLPVVSCDILMLCFLTLCHALSDTMFRLLPDTVS